MASISKDAKGRRMIQFVGANKKRRTIRLGAMPSRMVKGICDRVETLVHAQVARAALDGDTLAWLDSLSDKLYAKLARVGLVQPRAMMQLKDFLNAFIESRTDVKPNTKKNWKQAARYLCGHFGERRLLRDITDLDADAFVVWMKTNFAVATASRVIKFGKQFWDYAVRSKIITIDIWDHIKSGTMTNSDRQEFIERNVIAKVIEQCPDAEWRLIVALARFGGLRVPSEVHALTWPDILWDQDRFIVRAPKTGTRIVPLFPELVPFLRECFEAAEDGAAYVIAKHRNVSLRTRMHKIIERAGIVPWEKVFVNLRSTRETELCDDFPEHVVAKWLGNSKATARAHYNQTTDSHFQRAAKSAAPEANLSEQERTPEFAKTLKTLEFDNKPALVIGSENKAKTPELHPEGVEPPTYGSEDHCQEPTSSFPRTDLRRIHFAP
jgi:integrase